jgi:hypothetical protein
MIDAELLLDAAPGSGRTGRKGAGELVVVEGQDDVRHVGRPGGDILQLAAAFKRISRSAALPLRAALHAMCNPCV